MRKTLLNRIRRILRNRRLRRMMTRVISIVAALVVFVTTYALVLPAITMEREADCGIEAHQHDDSCYERQLVCDIPEDPGHRHDDACYRAESVLKCVTAEHTHGETCYDAEGNLLCEQAEHTHDASCYEEERELICGLEESAGHQHDDSCYENVLVCGKEVHVHSEDCYHQDPVEEEETYSAEDEVPEEDRYLEEYAVPEEEQNQYVDEPADEPDEDPAQTPADAETYDPGASSGAGGDAGAAQQDGEGASDRTGNDPVQEGGAEVYIPEAEAAPEVPLAAPLVPELEPLDFRTLLNSHTGIYYYHVQPGEIVENSAQITGWKKVSADTELGENDLLRVYLAYTLPAGAVNTTNAVVRYRLPGNLHLTDDQVKAINGTENGIAAQYVDYGTLTLTDPDNYHRYLGAEAVEGTRTPDQDEEAYLAAGGADGNGQEYISAVVRVENIGDTGSGDRTGQDLLFTFVPYTVFKNRHEYDGNGQQTGTGVKVRGWFSLDFNMGQVDFDEVNVDGDREIRTADVVFAEEDEGLQIEEIRTGLRLVRAADPGTEEKPEAADPDRMPEEGLAAPAAQDTEADGTGSADPAEDGNAPGGEAAEENAAADGDKDPENAEDGHNLIKLFDDSEEDGQKDSDQKDIDKKVSDKKDSDEKSGKDAPAQIMPAMSFEDTIRVSTGRPAGAETKGSGGTVADAADALPKKANVTVRVEADEGTFPAGTTMVLAAVKDLNAVAETVQETVENGGPEAGAGRTDSHGAGADAASGQAEKAAGSGKDGTGAPSGNTGLRTYGFQAVDISFRDADGNEIEPAKPVRVAMTSEIVEQVRREQTEDPATAVADPVVVHIDDNGNVETMDLIAPEEIEPARGRTEEELREEAEAEAAARKEEKEKEAEAANQAEEKAAGETEAAEKDAVDKEAAEKEVRKEGTAADHSGNTEAPAAPGSENTDAGEAEPVDKTETAEEKEEQETGRKADPSEGQEEAGADTEAAEPIEPGISRNIPATLQTVAFRAESFSVYVIVYTVDFHWEVDGKMYEFSLPGGGFVSLEALMEFLGVAEGADSGKEEGSAGSDTDETADSAEVLTVHEVSPSKTTREFVADIENVRFSTPELLWVSKVKENTTIGALKESLGLEVQYSAGLNAEQIEAVNNAAVESGDWALISLLPFNTEETLTVTMKTGEVFAVKVTDAQISTNILTADGKTYKITVTYEDDAQIPDGTVLDVSEIEPGTDEFVQHLGQAWLEVNKEYFEVEEMRGHYNEGMGDLPDVHPVNLDDARFFDINLVYDGQVIEPAAPVHVEIVYEEGLDAAGGAVAGVAHFTEEGVELIEDVETVTENDTVIRFSYDQPGFSDTGTYVGQETFDQTEGPVTAPAPDKTDYPMLKAAGKKGSEADGTSDGASNETTDDIAEENNLPKPVGNKTLTPNKASDGTKDDTYTLTLSVSGTSKSSTETIVNKSNVLIVMDRSSSMINNYVYSYTEYTGSYQNGTTYYGVDGDNYFTLYYNTRDGKYYRTYTSGPRGGYSNQYNGAIYTRTQKTRLAEEQTALSLLLNQLLSKNGTGTTAEGVSLEDIIEVSLISFADQRYAGKDTEIGWTTDYDRLMAGVNKGTYTSGTNWEDALQYALEVADAKQAEVSQAGEEMYIIFLTDGEPTAVHGEKNGAHHYNNVGGGFVYAYNAARDDAAALVNAGYHLYNIFTYGTDEDYGYMVRLTNYAYSNGANDTTNETTNAVKKYFTNARTTDKLLTAFQNIFSLVSDSVAYGKVSITDGLTTDAMTTTLVHGRAEGYKYTVTGSIGELYSVTAAGSLEGQTEVTFTVNGHDYHGEKKTAVIDGVSHEYWSCTIGEGEAAVEYKMTLADVSEDGMLTWDLTGIGALMDGYTYSASFVVWPDQEAYDYVAGLNNGLPGYTWSKGAGTYENLTSTKGYEKGGVERFPSIVRYPDGIFAVLTNTEQKVYYSIVETKEENGVTTTTYDGPHNFELPVPDPMPLKKTDMGVAKEWDDSLDPDQLDEILWKDHDGAKQDSTEYGVTLRVWRADTQEQLANMVEADADNSYMDVTVGWNESEGRYIWEENFDVSPGLMVSLDDAREWGVQIENDKIVRCARTAADSETGNESTTTDYYVLETGHYYTLSEPGIERHFELNTIVYHPMVVDGVLSNVMFKADGTVDRIVPMSTVTATNTLKGGINIQKKLYSGVPGAEGTQEITTTDETFSITVEMFNADGTPYVDWDYRVYYGDNNPLKTETTDVSGHYFGTAAAQAESGSSGEVDAVNGGHNTITLDYYPGDVVRIINIPAGVTYKVTETTEDGSAFTFDSTLYEISSGSADNFVPDTAGADGCYTVQGNASSQATVRNRTGLSEIELKKIGDGVTGNTLEGVQFVLYYDEECTRQVVKDALGREIGTTVTAADEETNEEAAADGETNEENTADGETVAETAAYDHVLITGADGKVRIGSLCGGTYYLVEISAAPGYNMLTEAIPVTIHADGTVTYTQESLTSLINSRQAVYEIEGGYGIHINNLSGFELPHTGGAGTYHIYLLGLMLTGLAGAGLMINRKRAA